MRAYGATFVGAFLIALVYSTKPDGGSVITIARSGDTALVVDTSPRDTAAASSSAPATRGSATPAVVPADLDALRAQKMVIPVAGVEAKDLVDSFDDTRDGTRHHNALDIMAARNTPAIAATSGTVLKLYNSTAGGLTVYMSDPTSRFVIMYGHLDGHRPGLKEGMAVNRGELIGFVGSTGNASLLAPHLHFQIMRNDDMNEWWKGTPINPFLVFRPR
ncbi:MAG: M23 family metallopeptidase [Gemmatimonadaceae bacterium]|nr:M23 family metallopeptidase [Gemmatimonadaceae bacterium]